MLPATYCPDCAASVGTNMTYRSSDPSVGYFVKVNLGGPQPAVAMAGGAPVADEASPIFCPLKTGSTVVSVSPAPGPRSAESR